MPKRLLYGVGINDANYHVRPFVNGSRKMCPYYATWSNMMKRAYCDKYHDKRPTYKDVTVCRGWHKFTTFKKWMQTQEWEGMHLDKDLRRCDNTVYKPSACLFVTGAVNNIVLDNFHKERELPTGVHESNGKFRVMIREYGKKRHIGYFYTPIEASRAYQKERKAYIIEVALNTDDKRTSKALFKIAKRIK